MAMKDEKLNMHAVPWFRFSHLPHSKQVRQAQNTFHAECLLHACFVGSHHSPEVSGDIQTKVGMASIPTFLATGAREHSHTPGSVSEDPNCPKSFTFFGKREAHLGSQYSVRGRISWGPG